MKRTAEDIVYSIRHILKKLNVKTDDINDRAIAQRIPIFAQQWMQDIFNRRRIVDPMWFMRLGLVQTTATNSGDDENVPNGSVVMSKYELSRITAFGGKSAIKVYNGLRMQSYTRMETFEMLFTIYRADRSMLEKYPSYVLTPEAVYIYPNKGLQLDVIPANPFEWNIKAELLHPVTGAIIHTKDEVRPFSYLDPYPITPELEYFVILDILEKDFAQDRNRSIDKMQDGNDETH